MDKKRLALTGQAGKGGELAADQRLGSEWWVGAGCRQKGGFVVMALQSWLKKTMELFLLVSVYGVCIALASALWTHPVKLTGCFVLVSILALIKWHTRADVIAYGTAAVLGPLGEAFAVHYGAWAYTKSSFLIPLWLPLLWGVAGFFLRRLTWTITAI
jgi:hypothetical protein